MLRTKVEESSSFLTLKLKCNGLVIQIKAISEDILSID